MQTKVVHCKMDFYDVYIGRPGPWGNPYSHDPEAKAEHLVSSREEAIELYSIWLRFRLYTAADTPEDHPDRKLMESILSLRGKTLGCWCSPLPCHGHVLAQLAEELHELGDKPYGYQEYKWGR